MNLKALSIAILLVAAVFAVAQPKPGAKGKPGIQIGHGGPGGPGGPGGGMRMRRGAFPPELEKQLNLTAAQKAKIKAIMDSVRTQMEKLKPEERRTKGREIFQGVRAKIHAVLNAKQIAILDKWRKDHPRPMGGPGGGRPGGPGGGRPGGGI